LRASSVTYLFAIFLFSVPCLRFVLLQPLLPQARARRV
jgi:hypothetical protein